MSEELRQFKNLGDEKPSEGGVIEVEEKEKQEKLRRYFNYLKPLGSAFSKYGAYGIRVDPNAESHAFNHETKEVIISTKITERFDLRESEQKYLLLHELGHLIQLFQNPEKYLETYEISEKKAKKASDPSLEQHFNKFFNVFFDVHDNSIVRRLMPIYQKGGVEENAPRDLYKEKLFSGKDYIDLPYSYQFLYSLLLGAMVQGEECKISEEVEKLINSPFKYHSTEYKNLHEFTQKRIFSPEEDIGDIMKRLKQALLPIFEKLLDQDKKKDRLKKAPETLGDMDIDSGVSRETIEKIVKSRKESAKSSSERYGDFKKANLKSWARDKGFSEDQIKEMFEIQERTEKSEERLEELWERLIQKTAKFSREKMGGYAIGSSLDTERTPQEAPILKIDPNKARIYKRDVGVVEKEEINPKKIVLFLLPDLSGSMHEDKRKIRAVQETAYSINKSLINFIRNGYLKTADTGGVFPISIDYRILGFGGTVEELTERTEKENLEMEKKDISMWEDGKDLDEELWRAIFKIGNMDLGGTLDAPALATIKNLINPDIAQKIKEGDELWIAIEITDGDTFTKDASKKLARELNPRQELDDEKFPNEERLGVIARAIQIPGALYAEKTSEEKKNEKEEGKREPPEVVEETGIFQEVWGKWGLKLNNIDSLLETVTALLYDVLRE